MNNTWMIEDKNTMTQKSLFRDVDLTKVKSIKSVKYTRRKLPAEEVTTIKKALIQFKTTELEEERKTLLMRLSHTDYFLTIYTAKRKRERGKDKNNKTDKTDKNKNLPKPKEITTNV